MLAGIASTKVNRKICYIVCCCTIHLLYFGHPFPVKLICIRLITAAFAHFFRLPEFRKQIIRPVCSYDIDRKTTPCIILYRNLSFPFEDFFFRSQPQLLAVHISYDTAAEWHWLLSTQDKECSTSTVRTRYAVLSTQE